VALIAKRGHAPLQIHARLASMVTKAKTVKLLAKLDSMAVTVLPDICAVRTANPFARPQAFAAPAATVSKMELWVLVQMPAQLAFMDLPVPLPMSAAQTARQTTATRPINAASARLDSLALSAICFALGEPLVLLVPALLPRSKSREL